jgi:DHA1 family bicyclomycin/chloramphenicol resistance-like MFS transporter
MMESAPVARRPVQLFFILGALSAFGPLSIDLYLPGLPAISHEFGASASETQLTLGVFVLGLALGQAVVGPLSDLHGRRRPLLVGLAAYAGVSLLCALAPSVYVLAGLRFLQGIAGASGQVIARAVVRDRNTGVAAARFFALLMLVTGLAPILAPILGGQILRFTSWRGAFVILAAFGATLLAVAAAGLEESLPPENRQSGGLRTTLKTFGRLLADRGFLGYALCTGLAFAAVFAYISGSPFVLQEIYGLSPQQFSLCFGGIAIGLVVGSQISGRLVGRVSPARLLAAGLISAVTGGIVLLVAILAGLGLAGVLPALFLVVFSMGFINPNATALALSGRPRQVAGSASALLGVLQMVIAAIAAPLVGVAGAGTALPMAIMIAAATLSALLVFLFLARPSPQPADPAGEAQRAPAGAAVASGEGDPQRP